LDYTDGTYAVQVNRTTNGAGMTINHRVTGQNLVGSLLKKSSAVFAAEVSSPYATYRQLHAVEATGEVAQSQQVSWGPGEVVPPVYVRPLVLSTSREPEGIVLGDKHGVHDVWQGQEVEVRAGTILATDQFWRAASTWQSLIRLVRDETLSKGSYRVEEITAEGYYFKVHMHPALFKNMINPGHSLDHRDSILTACLARGLEIIRETFHGDENQTWNQYPTLRALHEKLHQSGIETWDNEGFRADEAASRLKPLEFGSDGSD